MVKAAGPASADEEIKYRAQSAFETLAPAVQALRSELFGSPDAKFSNRRDAAQWVEKQAARHIDKSDRQVHRAVWEANEKSVAVHYSFSRRSFLLSYHSADPPVPIICETTSLVRLV